MNSTFNVSNTTISFLNETVKIETEKETDVSFIVIFTICCLIYMTVTLFCVYDCFGKFNLDVFRDGVEITISIYNFKSLDDKLKNYMETHKTDVDVECAICFENGNMVKTDCDHIYCKKCLSTWIEHNHTCPLCREFVL